MLIRKYNFYFYGTIGLKPSDIMEGKEKLSDMSLADLMALRDVLKAYSPPLLQANRNVFDNRKISVQIEINNRVDNIDFTV